MDKETLASGIMYIGLVAFGAGMYVALGLAAALMYVGLVLILIAFATIANEEDE